MQPFEALISIIGLFVSVYIVKLFTSYIVLAYCFFFQYEVNDKKYYGYGSRVDVAKRDALENLLQDTKQKTGQEVSPKGITTDIEENSTSPTTNSPFYLLNQMTNAFQYHCHTVDGFYFLAITVCISASHVELIGTLSRVYALI